MSGKERKMYPFSLILQVKRCINLGCLTSLKCAFFNRIMLGIFIIMRGSKNKDLNCTIRLIASASRHFRGRVGSVKECAIWLMYVMDWSTPANSGVFCFCISNEKIM